MSWVKLDDSFYDNPKVMQAQLVEPASTGLYCMALSYCGRHGTGGAIPSWWPQGKLPARALRARAIAALVDAGLWEEAEDGWAIHDYAVYNYSAEEQAERSKTLAEKRAEAGRRGGLASAQRRAKVKQTGKQTGSKLLEAKATPEPEPEPIVPPCPPVGGRARDRGRYEKEVEAFAAEAFPGYHPRLREQITASAISQLGPDLDAVTRYVHQWCPKEATHDAG